MFQLVALMDGESHVSMQAKALLVDTALLGGRRRLAGDGV